MPGQADWSYPISQYPGGAHQLRLVLLVTSPVNWEQSARVVQIR